MTIKEARKILGIASKDIPDKQIRKDIEVAEMLKSIFFSKTTKSKNSNIHNDKSLPNVP